MKRIIALVFGVSLLFVFVCSCDAKNDAVSSVNPSTGGEGENSSVSTQVDPSNYWQEYEGTPPANKKYVIYSTPLSGVKEGIVNDPKSDVLAVRDVLKLCFYYVHGCDSEIKPYTYITTEKTTEREVPRVRTVEYNEKKYSLYYNETETIVEAHTFAGKEYKYEIKYDSYSVYDEGENQQYGKIKISRETGKLFDFKPYSGFKYTDNGNAINSKEEARQTIIDYVSVLCGEDVVKDYKLETAEIYENTNDNSSTCYSVDTYSEIEGYKTSSRIHIGISRDGSLTHLGFYNFDVACSEVYKNAFQEYGKEAFDKAKAILESAVDLAKVEARCHIAFDSTGKLFYLAMSSYQYPNDGCWGSHPMHYAVEIIK